MPNIFWRAKRKVKIVKKTPEVKGSFGQRVKAHSLSGGLMATQMAADEIRGKGIDHVTRAFDRHYFKLNKPKKPQHQQIGDSYMEKQELQEFVAGMMARMATRRAASQAAKLAARKGSQKVAQATAQKAATSIAQRVAPKVTKPGLQHVSRRVGKGPIKAMRRLAHRTHARARLHRRIVSKEARLRPLTAMAKGAAKTAVADTAMRTVVDVGGHVGGSVAKQHVDKAMKTPKKYTARQQAADRQRENYREVVANLTEKKKPYIDNKKHGPHHDTHNAIIALHRQNSGGGKSMAMPTNNPSRPSQTNTRSRQNSDIDDVIQNLTEIPQVAFALGAMNPAVKMSARGPAPAASRASKKILSKVSGKKFENINELGPLLAIAGGTLLGTVAGEAALHAGKKGYKKAKAALAVRKIKKQHQAEKQTQVESFMAGVTAVGRVAKAAGSVASTTNTITKQRGKAKNMMDVRPPRVKVEHQGEDMNMDREELIQEIMEMMATTAGGLALTGGWAARRLAKRNKINKGIYARKAARTELRAKNLEFKAKLTGGISKQISKGKSRRLAGKAKRLQRKIDKAENYKQLAAKNEGRLSEIVDPEPGWHRRQRQQEKLGKWGKILLPSAKHAKAKKEAVNEGYLRWLTKHRQKKAGKLRVKAAKYRATSADFAGREQRGLEKKLRKVQRKQARYESEADLGTYKERKAIAARRSGQPARNPKERRAAAEAKLRVVGKGALAVGAGYGAGQGLAAASNWLKKRKARKANPIVQRVVSGVVHPSSLP